VRLFTISKHLFSDDEDTALGAGREDKSENSLGHQKPVSANLGFNIISMCGLGEQPSLFHLQKGGPSPPWGVIHMH